MVNLIVSDEGWELIRKFEVIGITKAVSGENRIEGLKKKRDRA